MDTEISRTYHSLGAAAMSVSAIAATISLRHQARQAPIFMGLFLCSVVTVQVSAPLNNVKATTASIWAVGFTCIVVVLTSPKLKDLPLALPVMPALVLSVAAGMSFATRDSSSSLLVACAVSAAATAWTMAFIQLALRGPSARPVEVAPTKVTAAFF